MNFIIILITILLLSTYEIIAQQNLHLNGYLRSKHNGESLAKASIQVLGLAAGTTSNAHGFYHLTLREGNYHLVFSHIGFRSDTVEVHLMKNTVLNLELDKDTVVLQEVTIDVSTHNSIISDLRTGYERVSMKTIKQMPALLGETDVLKSIQMLPGVQTVSEGNTGIFVRGGAADQTLILLDEVPVYNASHLFGFFSIFNADVINSLEIYKGGIPAKFGGRLSSVLDIGVREGNRQKFSVSGGAGMITSRVLLEGPIRKDKSSFIISFRRTYADLFLRALPAYRGNTVHFYDANAKLSFGFGTRNKIYVTGYTGRDAVGMRSRFRNNWGNTIGAAKWIHTFNNKLFLNTSLIYSRFDYSYKVYPENSPNYLWRTKFENGGLKANLNFHHNEHNVLTLGTDLLMHKFSPVLVAFEDDDEKFDTYNIDNKYALESALYISSTSYLNNKIKAEYGLRYSFFYNIGPGRTFTYEANEPLSNKTITDTTYYRNFQPIHFSQGLEPRLALSYTFTDHTSLKASYNRMRQFLQIASNSTTGLPIDRWIPSDKYIKPQISDQLSLGFYKSFGDYVFSAEGYYKWLKNQIDFKDGAELFLSNNIETEVLSGKAWAYGTEYMIKKQSEKLNGWVSYTLSRSVRQINGINNNKPYSPRYDRRHNINIALSYQFNKNVTLSSNWTFSSGYAVSYPKGIFELEGETGYYYTDRNGDRMPPYHRMDLSLNVRENRKKRSGTWHFSLYNVYNRHNAFAIEFRNVINNDPSISKEDEVPEVFSKELKSVKTYLFGIIPGVSYEVNF